MTWKAYNTAVRIPILLGNTIDQTKTVYIGAGDDAGYKLFYHSGLSKWVISSYFGMSFYHSIATSKILSPSYINYNMYTSYNAYPADGFSPNYLYYDVTFGWVLSGIAGLPCEEFWQPDDPFEDPTGPGSYRGTFFYSGTPPALGGTATFQARGARRGTTQGSYATTITVSTKYERWESSTLYGEYTAAGGASGTKYCGLPQWTDGDDNTYIRSLVKVSGKYTYGSISYNSTYSKWLIGTYGNVSGWYEGSEPSKTSPVTFTFTVPEGSELTGTNKTITFDEYVKGENTEIVLLTEASRWV